MELEDIGGARLWIFVAGIEGTKTTLLGKGLSEQGEGRTIAVGWITNSTDELINTQAAQLSEQ
ncbi:hypothetical protein C6501_03235 [Candidatus Poribacteria bacterium]|nr:MAG: hypothetical protein C6501_03235 [Candidatus Poribacteria bacterium]